MSQISDIEAGGFLNKKTISKNTHIYFLNYNHYGASYEIV